MRIQTWIAATFIASCAVTAGAQSPSYSGSDDYRTYCRSCHGAAGKGDGGLATSLKKPPADLTQLAKLNNGVFPEERVFKAIDGTTPDPAHTRSEMPAWGDVLAKSSDSAGAEAAAARIKAIVQHVQTLQAK